MSRAGVYSTLYGAGKAWGKALGYEGRAGGWVYRNGQVVCQGWEDLGRILLDKGVIVHVGGKYV